MISYDSTCITRVTKLQALYQPLDFKFVLSIDDSSATSCASWIVDDLDEKLSDIDASIIAVASQCKISSTCIDVGQFVCEGDDPSLITYK